MKNTIQINGEQLGNNKSNMDLPFGQVERDMEVDNSAYFKFSSKIWHPLSIYREDGTKVKYIFI